MSADLRRSARVAAMGATAAAGLAFAAWTGMATAGADPDPAPPVVPIIPVGPAVPPPPPGAPPADAAPVPQTLLGQAAAAVQQNPVSIMNDLLAASPQQALVGVAPAPPGSPPTADPLAGMQLLRPQNYRMPTDDQASPYALAPNDNPSPFARIDAWKGVHALVHSNLGRMPGDELGQPLPGTAPPPGTNIPAGLEQFYVDPAALPPAAPPVDPLLLGVPLPPAPAN